MRFANAPKVLVACVVLHNVAKSLGDADFEEDEEAPAEDDHVPNYNVPEGNFVVLRQQGQEARRVLRRIINTFND